MDNFDDLLVSSRRALEDNPFEDPFLKPRSSSPDPWATFGTQTAPHPEFDSELGTEADTETESSAFHEGQEEEVASEPLDVSSTISDDDLPTTPPPGLNQTTSPRTPGFRESAPSPPPLQPSKSEEEPKQSELLSPRTPPSSYARLPRQPSPPPSEAQSAEPRPYSPQTRAQDSPYTYTSPRARAVVSPLEQPSPSTGGFSQSFASLALGGESIGGWTENTQPSASFVNQHSVPASREPSGADEEEDDDDDDRPILETVKSAARDRAPLASTSSTAKKDQGLQPVFVVSVEDPQKVGDPIRGYTMYTVHTRTTSPQFSKPSFSVLRRYSDFLWLYETLSENNPGVVVPAIPEKSPFNRFEENFVQQRRHALEKCINKIANHDVLMKDLDLKLFLESDTFALDIKHRKAEIAHERGGLMATIGQTLAGPRFYETDEWFDRQKAYLDSLELQLRGLVKAIDLVAKQRADMAGATGEFAQTISDLAVSDVGKQLTHSLMAMADAERRVQELHNTQSQEDVNTIMSTVDEYARMINSVRLAFASRVRTYHTWQNAESEVRRVKQAHEKNRSQGRIPTDRLGQSLSLIAEAERRAMETKQDFEKASRLIKSEMGRFEQERIEDFKNSLQEFLDGMITRQQKVIGAWEEYQQSLLKRVPASNERNRNSQEIPMEA